MKPSVICCGSLPYKNIDINELVDSFDTIIRHNMLVPNCGYGRRDSTTQILNNHVYDFYRKKVSLNRWYKMYTKHYNITRKHIKKFYDYITQDKEDFHVINFPTNNTEAMYDILEKNNIELELDLRILRCGLSSVIWAISNGVKPSLIGYSLTEENTTDHIYKKGGKINKKWHNDVEEFKLIKVLHEADLIDATLCCLEDEMKEGKYVLNPLLTLREESLDRL